MSKYYPALGDWESPFPLYDDENNPGLHFRTTSADFRGLLAADFVVDGKHVPVPEGYSVFDHTWKEELPTQTHYFLLLREHDYLLRYKGKDVLLHVASPKKTQ